jgi:membrane-anchored protein YejM (alkaline phosphatase superfamily)
LNAERGPVLLGELQRRSYDVRGFTADDFSYPEFDRTVFAGLDRAQLHEFGGKAPSWQRDRAMVGEIVDYLDGRDPSRPFFLYAFFESPHARYDFPEETAVYKPYLESFDYVTMDLERDIDKIHNRYRNSVRHLDTQYERVLAELTARGLLDSTIVVITGDHGEEFMEHGRWGHNSAFTEQQIRVPLVLLAPGLAPGVVDRPSSHLDVPATLLGLLGVESPASDYSFGQSLLRGPERRYSLVSDWQTVTYVDSEGKVEFPMRAASFLKRPARDRSDGPLPDPAKFLRLRSAVFAEVLGDMSRLSARR